MQLFYILSSILISLNLQTNSFDFRKDYEKDRIILNQEHCIADLIKLKQFQKFTELKLNPLPSSKIARTVKGMSVKIWRSSSDKILSVYQIDCSVPIDTVYEISKIDGLQAEKYAIKSTFHFKYYVFNSKANPKRLEYFTEENEGLQKIKINSKEYTVAYESVALGFDIAYQIAKEQIEEYLRNK